MTRSTGDFELDPFANIVHGGWLSPDYFEKCLGSADIIAGHLELQRRAIRTTTTTPTWPTPSSTPTTSGST